MALSGQGWRRVFTACCFASLMTVSSTASIVAPIFAIQGPLFGLGTGQIATIFAVYYLPNVVSSLVAGVLASVYGRRRVLAVGCALLSTGSVALGLVPTVCGGGGAAAAAAGGPPPQVPCLFGLFVAARILQGMGTALAQTCLFAILADMWPEATGKVRAARTVRSVCLSERC
jgi:MFS family permease